jgi:hypothetical protein
MGRIVSPPAVTLFASATKKQVEIPINKKYFLSNNNLISEALGMKSIGSLFP